MLKLLVADEEKLIRWSLKEMFSKEGCTIDTTDIILLTASGLQQVEKRLGQKHVFALIEKPFNTHDLRAVVLKALELHRD